MSAPTSARQGVTGRPWASRAPDGPVARTRAASGITRLERGTRSAGLAGIGEVEPHVARKPGSGSGIGGETPLAPTDAMPPEHWSKLRSTNPLERVNREISMALVLGRRAAESQSQPSPLPAEVAR